MKAYTDIEQSRHLLEIGIPAESADMFYSYAMNINTKEWIYDTEPTVIGITTIDIGDIPCWSLAALLELMPNYILHSPSPLEEKYYCCRSLHSDFADMEFYGSTPIDAAYKMVIWLKENKYV